jgi:hypothetical protein
MKCLPLLPSFETPARLRVRAPQDEVLENRLRQTGRTAMIRRERGSMMMISSCTTKYT